MTQVDSHDNRFQERIKKSTWSLAYWTFGWVLTAALLAFGPKFLWNKNVPLTLVALGINLAVGAGMIIANKNHLQSLDELLRKVHLDAMAVTLGVVLITCVPYSLLDAYGILPFKADMAHLAVLMSFTYLACILVGLRRYR